MERRRNAEQPRDPAGQKRAIGRAADHADFMYRSGQLSHDEIQKFRKLAIAQSLDSAVEPHETEMMLRSGLHDYLQGEAGHDEGVDPDESEQARRHVGLKVLSNFISDPGVRHLITSDELDHLKRHGVDLGKYDDDQIHERLDDLYARSAKPDGPLFDKDIATEDVLDHLAAGRYGSRARERDQPKPQPRQADSAAFRSQRNAREEAGL